jgi:hypothetical protein
VNISTNYSSFTSSLNNQNMVSNEQRPPKPPQPVEGELSGFLSESRGDSEVKEFMQGFMEMNMSGEFDAATLAEQAPESLKAYAEEQGVDLEEMLQQAHDKFSEMGPPPGGKGGRPMPPPELLDASSNKTDVYAAISELGDADSELIDSLISSLSIKTAA